ncbi:MAG TPA: GxxExxY protein [Deltaproteobacteria bacterium]|nr:GxxExxY protein [Deltaproteobacteria bacterium]
MLHEELTGEILGACFEVGKELGHGFLETVYERALAVVLRQRGLEVATQVPLAVLFRGQVVGEYVADMVVEGQVLVELKAVKALLPEHQAQVINYLKTTGLTIGLLVNFGTPRVEYKRCYWTEQEEQDRQDG